MNETYARLVAGALYGIIARSKNVLPAAGTVESYDITFQSPCADEGNRYQRRDGDGRTQRHHHHRTTASSIE